MTRSIVTFGIAAAVALAMATPSFAQSRRENARDAYAMDSNSGGYAPGWERQNMPARAAGLWRPGMCWHETDKLRRFGWFEACKR